ncbi:MAG: hypothetical protein Q4G59_06505, partial [Planctomycetia bacterium]|nr:hypothetical protein [Planctomycetia bacterium]
PINRHPAKVYPRSTTDSDKVSEVPVSTTEDTVAPAKSVVLSTAAFGYESQMPQSQWQTLLPQEQNLVCFDDITQSAQTKNDFAAWVEQHQKSLARCVMLTDCSCPPARQLTLYLQKRIFPFVQNVHFIVILSRGERLREKFRNNTSAIDQRLQDWNDQLKELAAKANVPLTLISYYDHELDLAAARNRLTTELAGSKAKSDSDGTKITQAAKLVMSDVNELFAVATIGDDEILTRLSRFYESLTEIYREESRSFLQDATSSLPSGFGIDFIRQQGTQWLGPLGQAVEGINAESIQERLVPATAVMNRMRQFCSRLSPRCALCAASIAATLPVAAAQAPLAAGTLSIASVAAVVTQLGTLLPTVAASGAVGGAVGSVLPLSFGAVKDKLKQGFSRLIGDSRNSQANSEQAPSSDLNANASSVQLYLSSAMTWIAIFQFQGMEQSQIAQTLNEALSPLEESSVHNVDEAQVCVQQVIERITQLKQLSGNVI